MKKKKRTYTGESTQKKSAMSDHAYSFEWTLPFAWISIGPFSFSIP